MALKFFLKIIFPLYLFFFSAIYSIDEDFHDFYYQADFVIDMECSLFELNVNISEIHRKSHT